MSNVVINPYNFAAAFTNTLSCDFDGVDDHVLTDAVVGSTTDVSVSFWIKSISGSFGGAWTNLYPVALAVGHPNGGLVKIMNSKISIQGYAQDGTASTSLLTYNGATLLNDNAWHHVLAVFTYASGQDGSHGGFGNSIFKFYVDGSLETIENGAEDCTLIKSYYLGVARELNVGALVGFYGTPYGETKGFIDEVAIWENDQSANIGAIYNSGTPDDLSSLSPLGWWRMGDGDTFPTLTDHGSGGDDGTMTNMVAGDIVTDTP